MKYHIRYNIDAFFTAEVEANSLEEAFVKADKVLNVADFGEIEDIDVERYIAYDEDGDRIWSYD